MARPTGAEALEDFEGIERRYAQSGHEACGEAVHTQLLQLVGATRARMRLARWQDLPRWPQGARHSSCLNKRLPARRRQRSIVKHRSICLIPTRKWLYLARWRPVTSWSAGNYKRRAGCYRAP